MKIIKQTEDVLSTKEGNTLGIVAGTMLFFFIIWFSYNSLQANRPVIFWILAVILFLTSIYTVLFSKSIIIDFDKINKQVVYQKKSLVGKNITNYNFTDISNIETRTEWVTPSSSGKGGFSFNNQNKIPMSQSFIILKNGVRLEIGNKKGYTTSGILSFVVKDGVNKELSLASQIAAFIGVPFKETSPDIDGVKIFIGPDGITARKTLNEE